MSRRFSTVFTLRLVVLAVAVIISACDNDPLLQKSTETPLLGRETPLLGRIVFSDMRDGNNYNQIYTVNADGTDLIQVTFFAEDNAYSPSWSPGGDSIVFVSDSTYWDLRGGDGLFIIAADGSTLRAVRKDSVVTRAWGLKPAWSPAGDLIAYYSIPWGIGKSRPWLFARDLGVGWSWGIRHGADPAWSPDGTMLAFVYFEFETAHTQVYIDEARLILPSSPGERITDTPTDKRTPVWSPDGTRIAYISDTQIMIHYLQSSVEAGLPTVDVPFGFVPEELHAWMANDEEQLLVTYRDSNREYKDPDRAFAGNVQYLYAVADHHPEPDCDRDSGWGDGLHLRQPDTG